LPSPPPPTSQASTHRGTPSPALIPLSPYSPLRSSVLPSPHPVLPHQTSAERASCRALFKPSSGPNLVFQGSLHVSQPQTRNSQNLPPDSSPTCPLPTLHPPTSFAYPLAPSVFPTPPPPRFSGVHPPPTRPHFSLPLPFTTHAPPLHYHSVPPHRLPSQSPPHLSPPPPLPPPPPSTPFPFLLAPFRFLGPPPPPHYCIKLRATKNAIPNFS